MGRTSYSYGGTARYKKGSGCSGRWKMTEGQAEDGVMEDVMEDGVMKMV